MIMKESKWEKTKVYVEGAHFSQESDVDHIPMKVITSNTVADLLGLNFKQEASSLHDNMLQSIKYAHNYLFLPIICNWKIWNAHNRCIFNEKSLDITSVCYGGIGLMKDYPVDYHPKALIMIGFAPIFHMLKGSSMGMWYMVLVVLALAFISITYIISI